MEHLAPPSRKTLDMSEAKTAGPIERLRGLGRPDSFESADWPDYPAMYGFDATHIPALIDLAIDADLLTADETEGPQVWAPFLACAASAPATTSLP